MVFLIKHEYARETEKDNTIDKNSEKVMMKQNRTIRRDQEKVVT